MYSNTYVHLDSKFSDCKINSIMDDSTTWINNDVSFYFGFYIYRFLRKCTRFYNIRIIITVQTNFGKIKIRFVLDWKVGKCPITLLKVGFIREIRLFSYLSQHFNIICVWLSSLILLHFIFSKGCKYQYDIISYVFLKIWPIYDAKWYQYLLWHRWENLILLPIRFFKK